MAMIVSYVLCRKFRAGNGGGHNKKNSKKNAGHFVPATAGAILAGNEKKDRFVIPLTGNQILKSALNALVWNAECGEDDL
jgi:hypothetical protein